MTTQLDVSELYLLAKYIEMGVERNAFTKEECEQIFPAWNKVLTLYDTIRRKKFMQNHINPSNENKQHKSKLPEIKEENN